MRRAGRGGFGLQLRHMAGVTLPELIISIVIISVALAGVLLMINTTVVRSADPMIQQQAMAIAEAYLEEISARPYGPPSGADDRADFRTVGDYATLSPGPPADQFGNPLAGLEAYQVTVNVVDGATIGGVSDAQRIDISVAHGSGVDVRISGYKLDY
jgi:MSHA pilin protein MshD